MNCRFDKVTIIGVGLLGGSLGLALKTRGVARHITGVGHRQSSLDKALEVGAVDAVSLDAGDAAREADLIVICTPAATVPDVLDTLQSGYKPGAVVTDVASTKARICRHAADTWPNPLRFVGSHPMAGSEKYGPENATADLYDGCVTFVQKSADLDAETQQAVIGLWQTVGARVIEIAPETHDRLVARTSHIPHIAAAALAMLAAKNENASPFIGQGFRDATRIAASRAEIWRDICLTNSAAIGDGLDELIAGLRAIRDAIGEEDAAALEAFFTDGREARRKALHE